MILGSLSNLSIACLKAMGICFFAAAGGFQALPGKVAFAAAEVSAITV